MFIIEKPVNINNVTLIPVVYHSLQTHYNAMSHWFTAIKEPLVIIVCDSNGIRAFDMSSNEVSIASLSKKIPDLTTLLTSQKYHSVAG